LLLLNGKRRCEGIKYLILAALIGGFGFLGIYDAKLNIYLCEKFGCFFAGTFFWFAATPICTYLIHNYYNSTHDKEQNQNIIPVQ